MCKHACNTPLQLQRCHHGCLTVINPHRLCQQLPPGRLSALCAGSRQVAPRRELQQRQLLCSIIRVPLRHHTRKCHAVTATATGTFSTTQPLILSTRCASSSRATSAACASIQLLSASTATRTPKASAAAVVCMITLGRLAR